MQGKRMRQTKRRGGWPVLLILLAVLVAIVYARATDTQGDVVEETAYIEQSPEGTATPAPLRMPTPSLSATPSPPLLATDVPVETPTPETAPVVNDRYAALSLTQEDIDILAAIVFLEAGNQSAEGQQAVAEVVLNRIIASNFPDTLHEVVFQGLGTDQQQFTPAGRVSTTTPNAEQYGAVDAALYGESILPEDVVYFSTTGENSRVWGTIGSHVFCYQYVWG